MGALNYLALAGFVVCTLSSFFSMMIGAPMALFSPSVWRAWQDLFKGTFGLIMTVLVKLTSPTKIRVYSSSDNLKFRSRNDILVAQFCPRAVVMANHQTYSDWVFMWFLAYASNLQGAIVVTLKKSLKNIPVLGWAMQMFHFLFLSRKWEDDQENIKSTTQFLSADRSWATWLCLFPEGTVFNQETWRKTEDFADKTGVSSALLPKHMLLPRVKGLYTILQGLQGSLPVLYDFTFVYEPVSANPAEAVESRFSLKRSFIEGKGPKTTKVFIREFPVHEIPYQESEEAFKQWMYARWAEKDQIYADLVAGHREAEFKAEADVRPGSFLELYQCFNVPLTLFMLTQLLWKFVTWM